MDIIRWHKKDNYNRKRSMEYNYDVKTNFFPLRPSSKGSPIDIIQYNVEVTNARRRTQKDSEGNRTYIYEAAIAKEGSNQKFQVDMERTRILCKRILTKMADTSYPGASERIAFDSKLNLLCI